MFQWMREVLTSFEAQGPAGELAFILSVLLPLLGMLGTVYGFTRRAARKRYNAAIETRDSLQLENKTLKEKVETEAKRVATLEQNAPDTFFSSVRHAERDGNVGPAATQSERYLDFHAKGLSRAYSLRMSAEIANAAKDGGLSYANALAFAQAARLSDPDNERLAQIIPELKQAVAVSAAGAQVKIKENSDPAQAAFDEYHVLRGLTQKQRDTGNVLIYVETAQALARLAKRLFPAGSVQALDGDYYVADAMFYNGKTEDAADQVDKVIAAIPPFTPGSPMAEFDWLFSNAANVSIITSIVQKDFQKAAKVAAKKVERLRDRAPEKMQLVSRLQLLDPRSRLEQDPALGDEGIEICNRLEEIGATGSELGTPQNKVSEMLTGLGRSEEALDFAEKSLANHRKDMLPTNVNFLTAQRVVGKCLGNVGRFDEALAILEPLAERQAQILPDGHYDRRVTDELIRFSREGRAKAPQA